MNDAIIEIESFGLSIPGAGHARPVLDGIDLVVRAGTFLGIVGESGSGKSILSRAMLGDIPPGAIGSGRLTVLGVDMLSAPQRAVRSLRQRDAAMVFQDPRAAVNPVHRIGDFLSEHVVQSGVLSREAARRRAIELLDQMWIPNPSELLQRYPSELSGGMLQRVVIAGALMARPKILLCDEATTALDVTTQAEIVSILRTLSRESGTTLVFVTHDLELAGDVCDELCVLYAGTVLESGPTEALLERPRHPYTRALLASTPRLNDEAGAVLPSIPGSVLPLTAKVAGCVFADRCGFVTEECREARIPLRSGGQRSCRCIHAAAPEVITR